MIYLDGWQLKFNLFSFSFPEENPDRGFIKSQLLPEGVNQISVIGEMDCLGIVADNSKGWRPTCYLSCIKKFDAFAPVQ